VVEWNGERLSEGFFVNQLAVGLCLYDLCGEEIYFRGSHRSAEKISIPQEDFV